jgi:hypothetical protein
MDAFALFAGLEVCQRPAALRYIPDDCRVVDLGANLEMRNRGFGRKLRTVGTPGRQRTELSHLTRRGAGCAESIDVFAMLGPQSLWQQHGERATDDIARGIAEHLFGRRIEHDDVVVAINCHDRVHRRHDDSFEA